jgi:hypothetical protein
MPLGANRKAVHAVCHIPIRGRGIEFGKKFADPRIGDVCPRREAPPRFSVQFNLKRGPPAGGRRDVGGDGRSDQRSRRTRQWSSGRRPATVKFTVFNGTRRSAQFAAIYRTGQPSSHFFLSLSGHGSPVSGLSQPSQAPGGAWPGRSFHRQGRPGPRERPTRSAMASSRRRTSS